MKSYINQYIASLECELRTSDKLKSERKGLIEKQIAIGRRYLKCKSGHHLPPRVLACPPNPKFLNTDQNFKFLFGMLANLVDKYEMDAFLKCFHHYFICAMMHIAPLVDKQLAKQNSDLSGDQVRDMKKDKYDEYCALTVSTMPEELQVKIISVVTSYSFVKLEDLLFSGAWTAEEEHQNGYSLFISEYLVFLAAINKYLDEKNPAPKEQETQPSESIDRFAICRFFPSDSQKQREQLNKAALATVSAYIQGLVNIDKSRQASLMQI